MSDTSINASNESPDNSTSSTSVTTPQGRLVQQESGGACAILGMTLSRMDLVFVCFRMRSVQRGEVTPRMPSNLLKGLILR